jgi:flagellar biosynthesis/type III secretory pathway M-ring protein FliF/YscJ
MSYFVLGLVILVVLLIIALAVAVKVAQSRGQDLKEALDTARKTVEYHEKKEEIQKHADEQKASLHTGDPAADFRHTLDVLHNAGKGP